MSYTNKGERNNERGEVEGTGWQVPWKVAFYKTMEKRGNWTDDFSKGSWPALPHPESSNQIPHSPAWRLGSHHQMVVKAGGFYCSNSDVGKWRKLTPSAEELQTTWPRVLRLRRIRAISQVLPAPHSPTLFSLLELHPEEKPLTENACQSRPWANACQLPSNPCQRSDTHL